jgi:hypothetical protein
MIYFGWPDAHENDAERCVRSALEIVQAVKGSPLQEGSPSTSASPPDRWLWVIER